MKTQNKVAIAVALIAAFATIGAALIKGNSGGNDGSNTNVTVEGSEVGGDVIGGDKNGD